MGSVAWLPEQELITAFVEGALLLHKKPAGIGSTLQHYYSFQWEDETEIYIAFDSNEAANIMCWLRDQDDDGSSF